MPADTQATFSIVSVLSKAALLGGTPSHRSELDLAIALATGTGLNQADLRWVADTRSLAATTSESLDVAGSLVDVFGATLTFARLKLIVFQLITDTAGYTLEIGGAGSNQCATMFGDVSDKLIVRAGGFAILYAPDATAYGVTASTADLIKVNNPNAAGITYNAIFVGASA